MQKRLETQRVSAGQSARKSFSTGHLLAHTLLIMACIVTALPFVYVVSLSLRYFRDIVSGALAFTPTLTSYRDLFSGSADFPQLLLNSLSVATLATLVCLVVGSLGAYGLTRFHWRPWIPNVLLGWLVVVQTVPAISLAGPYYIFGLQTGLYNTKLLLVLVYTLLNLPLVVWMMIAYFRSIPQELEEAAVIDGCSWWGVFYRIVIPLATPALAASGLLAFIFSWKEFLLALTLTSTPAAMTLPVGIAGFVQDFNVEYGLMSAAAAIATVPGLLLAAFAQRYIVSGLVSGAVKS